MEYTITRNRRQMRARGRNRSDKEREILDQAKGVLMERNSMTEEEAHRYIQKRSMDNGTGMVETAQMILSLMVNA
jgi:response regulator NasT